MKKNISHKITAILLSVFMTFFIFPANVFATSGDTSSGTTDENGYIRYPYDENKSVIGMDEYQYWQNQGIEKFKKTGPIDGSHLNYPYSNKALLINKFFELGNLKESDQSGINALYDLPYWKDTTCFYQFNVFYCSNYDIYTNLEENNYVRVFIYTDKPLLASGKYFSVSNMAQENTKYIIFTVPISSSYCHFRSGTDLKGLISDGKGFSAFEDYFFRYNNKIVSYPSYYFLDSNGNKVNIGGYIDEDVGGGGDISSDGFKLQTQLGIYSKYEISDYPKSPPLTKFDGFYNTPDQAFLDDNVKKTGPKLDYGKFYFNPSQVTDGNSKRAIALALFNKRYYSYHLYYFVQSQFNTGGEWRKKSVWSSSPLVFEPATIKDGEYFTPKMKVRDSSIAVVVDYGADKTEMSVLFSGSLLFLPPVTSSTLQHFVKYYINDDEQVKKDTSSRNNGTLTVVPDGNGNDTVINGSGDDVTDDEDNGWGIGSVLPPKPPKPDENSGVLDWFKWLYDSVGLFFTTVTKGISSIFTQCSSFFSFLGETFSFFPSEVWTLITVGIGLIIVLRFLGR